MSSAGAAIAARKATATVPIVQASGGDPVRNGLAASLSRPGGNLTGISNLAEDLSGKLLEQLTLMAPSVRRFGVLFNPANATHQMRLVEAQRAGRALAVEVHAVTASSNTLDQALDKLGHGQVGGLVVLSDGMFLTGRHEIIGRVAKAGLPAIYQIQQFVTGGGLMSYGISIGTNYRRAATYVHRILIGAKPADLPIETARTFDFVINLKTAKALRLSVPRFLLISASEIIE